MNYEFLKDLIGSPWQIEPQTLNQLYPVFRGMFSGLHIDNGVEPSNHLPYVLNASTREPIMDYYAVDQPEQPSDEPKAKVVNILPVRSMLMKNNQECGPVGTRTLAQRLLKADNEESVIGHVLIIESGGGQASAVPELTEAILKCTKPVVAWIDGMAASAAYYIACYAKEIISSREMDMVGCIGTMTQFEGRKSKSPENSFGEVSVTIYADGSEEKNADYDAAINDFDFKLIKERLLNPINDRFKTDVKANRPGALDEQLKGRTYFSKDVVGSLVDSIGPLDMAVDRVLELANFKPAPPQGSSQTIIKTKKEMKQFSHLNSVLNTASLEATDEGVFLNEGQLQSVEERLELNQQLVTERDAAISERDTAQSAITAAYDPFNAIDPAVASATTVEAKAEAIRTLLATRPGSKVIQNLGTKDEIKTDPSADWEVINNLPHNKQVDANS
jgi:protease-4